MELEWNYTNNSTSGSLHTGSRKHEQYCINIFLWIDQCTCHKQAPVTGKATFIHPPSGLTYDICEEGNVVYYSARWSRCETELVAMSTFIPMPPSILSIQHRPLFSNKSNCVAKTDNSLVFLPFQWQATMNVLRHQPFSVLEHSTTPVFALSWHYFQECKLAYKTRKSVVMAVRVSVLADWSSWYWSHLQLGFGAPSGDALGIGVI